MAHLKLWPHRLAQLTSCSAIPSNAAHFKLFPYCLAWLLSFCPHRLAQLISSSATPSSMQLTSSSTLSIAAQLMLCYAVWDISHQVLLHRLAQPTSALPPSSMAHLKLCPHRLAQLTSCSATLKSTSQLTSSSATPSSAAHIKLCYTLSSAAHLKLCSASAAHPCYSYRSSARAQALPTQVL